ncbi:hypothetical protein ACFWCB_14145 [Streptomyces sp. NPDC060048]|uniref:hypothetical protein n=1 Tax=unclassified Streptomyces TaxID=2593676 RepID=UPI0036CFF29A
MTSGDRLFSLMELATFLNHQLHRIAEEVAALNEDVLLSSPESDVCEELEERFRLEPLVLDRDGITAGSVKEGFATVRQFGEELRIRQTVVTILVRFKGELDLFHMRPSTYTNSPPVAATDGDALDGGLEIEWMGPVDHDPQQVRLALDSRLDEIQRWIDWSTAQVVLFNEAATLKIAAEVQARKTRLLANRNLQEALGFPMRERHDAATYSVPIKRKKIVPKRGTASSPFEPEPALADAHYEAALEVLRNQRNALERAPGTSAKMGEEEIRNLLLIGLNSHFEGQAAGEVFNNTGKTDILIRVDDRHIFIGECKIWKGPKTIADTVDQLLGYLTWRDTKAALLLFIRSGAPGDVMAKAVARFREHPNYKRNGRHSTDERHDFVFHANGDASREIKMAFLPFHLPKDPQGS